jgi:dTMP kinase
MVRTEKNLIVIEGVDGTGKTLLAQKLAHILREYLGEVMVTSEPFRFRTEKPGNGCFSLFRFVLDRLYHLNYLQYPLDRGEIVVMDRYKPSTYVYQYKCPITKLVDRLFPDPHILILLNPRPVDPSGLFQQR